MNFRFSFSPRCCLNTALLTLYLLVVWAAYIFVYVTSDLFTFGILLAVIIVPIFLFCRWVVKRGYQLSIPIPQARTRNQLLAAFLFSAGISIIVMLVYLLAYYPGSFSNDSIGQIVQVTSGYYNDWHPVWQTLVAFRLPLLLTGRISSIVPIQMFCFSLIMGYMGMLIYRHAGVLYAALALAYILLNPLTGYILLFPWKDVTFSASGLLCFCMASEIYFTKGICAKKRLYPVLLGFLLTCTTLFRHNAILFTAMLAFALLFQMDKRHWAAMMGVFILSMALIKGPIYTALGVESPDNRVMEQVGLPMTIIANATVESPDLLDEETSNFVFSLAPLEHWQQAYICGNFNSIKWSINTTSINDKGVGPILRMTMNCFRRAPIASFRGMFALTDLVYGIETEVDDEIISYIVTNNLGLVQSGNPTIAGLLETYRRLINQTFFHYISMHGVALILILFACMAKLNLFCWKDWKRMFLALPIFSYAFGTMLLLTGNDLRFFFITYLLCPYVIILMFREKENEE